MEEYFGRIFLGGMLLSRFCLNADGRKISTLRSANACISHLKITIKSCQIVRFSSKTGTESLKPYILILVKIRMPKLDCKKTETRLKDPTKVGAKQ